MQALPGGGAHLTSVSPSRGAGRLGLKLPARLCTCALAAVMARAAAVWCQCCSSVADIRVKAPCRRKSGQKLNSMKRACTGLCAF